MAKADEDRSPERGFADPLTMVWSVVLRAALAVGAIAFAFPAARAQEPAPAAGAVATGPEWTILPSISGNETFNDNVRLTAKQREADLATTVAPGIYVNGDTPRLQTTLSYNPQIIEHAQASDQDQILQNLIGTGTLSAVPNLLFVDANASIANVDRSGGLGYDNQVQIPKSQSTQTTVYALSPYMLFHFGDTGDSQIRYRVAQSVFSGNTGPTASTTTGTALGSISNTTDQQGTASFTTGEALARLQLTTSANYSNVSGGTQASSKDETGDVDGVYQISGPYFAIADIGYERLSFSQTSAGNFTGPTWQLGARFQPREDRRVTVTYGRNSGNLSVSANAAYAVTPITSLTLTYGSQTTTQQQQLLQGLGALTASAPGSAATATGTPVTTQTPGQQLNGTTVNSSTGIPSGLQNPNLALQDTVNRSTTFQMGVQIQGGGRNSYALTINRTENAALSGGGVSQTSDGGTIAWNREMSPDMTGVFSAGYATTSSSTTTAVLGAGTTTSTVTLTAGLSYALSESWSSGASYSLSRQAGGTTGVILDDIVIVSLRKQF